MRNDAKEKLGRLYDIYLEAGRMRSFIFDKSTGAWFTPELFRKEYENKELRYTQITALMEVLVIRNPIAGFVASEKQTLAKVNGLVSEIHKELARQTEFAKFVIHYYLDEDPKRKL